jgi:hypothetical protein
MVKVPSVACQFALAFATSLLVAPFVHAESGDLISHNFDRVPALHTDSRVFRVSSELQVNPDTSYRLVVPNKCEELGEMELELLAGTSAVEESYVFIPSLCLWIETGHSETAKTVRLDTNFVDDLLRDYHSIVIYHIHVGSPNDVTEYFPAYSDLVGLILMNAKFLKDSRVKIGHRAVTSRGTIDYALVVSEETERLLEKLAQTGLSNFVAQNLAYEFARNTHKQKYYAAVRDCTHLSGGSPESLADCFPMRADDFVLNYRAVEDYVVTKVEE